MTATAYKLNLRHIKKNHLACIIALSWLQILTERISFMKRHSDTGNDIDALEDIWKPIYAVVYAKHNVYVLSVV